MGTIDISFLLSLYASAPFVPDRDPVDDRAGPVESGDV
jgi:hypothetical protein